MSVPISVAIAYHSGYGHTARQASAVADGAGSVPGVRADLRDVSTLDDGLWQTLADAEAIVFGSPTYMGTTSAVFQRFAEASGPVWAARGWQGKLAAGFTNSAGLNGNKDNALLSMAVLAAQHGMNWVPLGLLPGWIYSSGGSPEDLNRLGSFVGAMAQSPSDLGPEQSPTDADLRTARHLGEHVARTALQFVHGREAAAALAVTA
ncbi:NADPH-dependent FMN reductase [Streptomyces sp. CC53]|uniref:flavodoxin family protein n=1 Tax=unclassified Streptomyces TaxID=2593676 RepID=UPI0008DC8A74|nr:MULTISPECIES: flavodoxin family protein [unclassified Streptomyces]OII65667.1 NADPH-dependent FMN reductase [Streptomyces sp. CC53]OII67198.1 NADPH-dependent FMN reductase [Streptomyces sp. CC77]